ncbi:MAG: YlxR family protein [Lachnospiraceae bacterium]|nr:YlxR family protein [Lachnospiraceae bacterium]
MIVKKVPNRKCVACNEVKPKAELARIIRTPEGQILFDPTGKKNGRGAYICKSVECLKKAEKSKALARSLETEIPKEVYVQLAKELSDLE